MFLHPFLPSYLSEVGALGAPHGRGAHPEDDGARDERVELGVELRPDVGRVAEHGQHLGMRDASFHLTQDLTKSVCKIKIFLGIRSCVQL